MDPVACLQLLIAGESLSECEAEALFGAMLIGEIDERLIAGLLAALAAKGPTVDELTGAARVMRAHVMPVPYEPTADERLIDTCGTGGAPKTFNISTAAALIAASTEAQVRVLVAKHGNRSRTGRGSAEVLAALGVQVDAPPEVQAECLREAGVCFCFAIHHHPAMRYAGAVRRALGVPTIFNAIGPLTNPASASRQLIGVYAPDLVGQLAECLARLGAERAMVVRGHDGLDEITTTTTTAVAHVADGKVEPGTIDPSKLGLERCSIADLQVTSIEEGAAVIRSVIAGEAGPRRDITLLNSSAALLVAGAADSMEDGLALAADAVDSGRAVKTLKALTRVSHCKR